MICARGKSNYKTFTLAARDAARRFTLRHSSGSRTNRWLALVLRWRQKRQLKANVKADRVVPHGRVLHFSQFHFHFATYLSDRNRRHSSPKVFPATTIYRERIVLDRNSTSVVKVNNAAPPRRKYRPSLINYAGRHSQSKPDSQNTERSSSPRRFESVPKHVATRQRNSFVAGIPASWRVSTRREELTQFFKTHWRIRENWPQVFSVRLPVAENYFSRRSPDTRHTQIQFERPEELVWRRVRPSVDTTEDVRRSNTSESVDRAPVRKFSEEPATTQVVSPSIRRPQEQLITKLDPGLMDRLADDVIRRVEQRARIERQRRGL